MPYYWNLLYRPKRPDETEEDKILRKLSFKLPVVLRYNLYHVDTTSSSLFS